MINVTGRNLTIPTTEKSIGFEGDNLYIVDIIVPDGELT